jgi:predicted glycoside hydrolase/deacetylase ChbG (UPF0249 family)
MIATGFPTRDRRVSRSKPVTAVVAAVVAAVFLAAGARSAGVEPSRELLIRCDDVGMSHSVNLAVRELLETGLPFSVSVMVPCPWFLEAVEILSANPEIGVGLHLTLNSEWSVYKWGPVAGARTVPSLVDETGFFFASEAGFAGAEPKLDEVQIELEAQIRRALAAGLRIDYLDYHMLTAVSTPELRSIVEGLAEKYGFGLSRYFGETSVSLWADPPEGKLTSLLGHTRAIKPGLSLLVIHLGMETPEMTAMVDLNNADDPYRVAVHRQAELDAVTSPAFRRALAEGGIELVTYRDVIDSRGLDTMTAPADLTSYSSDFADAD